MTNHICVITDDLHSSLISDLSSEVSGSPVYVTVIPLRPGSEAPLNTCPQPSRSHPGHNGLNEELNFQHHDPRRMFGGWDFLVALELYFNSLTVMVISGFSPALIQPTEVSLRCHQHTRHGLQYSSKLDCSDAVL